VGELPGFEEHNFTSAAKQANNGAVSLLIIVLDDARADFFGTVDHLPARAFLVRVQTASTSKKGKVESFFEIMWFALILEMEQRKEKATTVD
jgi:hypothetical protein